MLKKLIKYELQSSARVFLPLYAALLTLALINSILGKLGNAGIFQDKTIASFFVLAAFYAIVFALFAITFVIIIKRFTKNLLGREGYLMFTLPVSVSSHIWAKFISAFIWILSSTIVVILSSSLILLSQEYFRDSIIETFGYLYKIFLISPEYTGMNRNLLIAQTILAGTASFAFGIMLIYASISVGHLVKRHKTITSVVVYIGFSTIINNPLQILLTYNMTFGNFKWIFLAFSATYLAFAAGCFALTRYILQNKLNLE